MYYINMLIRLIPILILVKSSVLPTECFFENKTFHDIRKRETIQEQSWMFNNNPVEILPTIEASMAPTIQSRMCEYDDEDNENVADVFVTMDDFKQYDNPQIGSRNSIPEEQQEESGILREPLPNNYVIEEIIMEPINFISLPVENQDNDVIKNDILRDPVEMENSEMVAEAKDVNQLEIGESEKTEFIQDQIHEPIKEKQVKVDNKEELIREVVENMRKIEALNAMEGMVKEFIGKLQEKDGGKENGGGKKHKQ